MVQQVLEQYPKYFLLKSITQRGKLPSADVIENIAKWDPRVAYFDTTKSTKSGKVLASEPKEVSFKIKKKPKDNLLGKISPSKTVAKVIFPENR